MSNTSYIGMAPSETNVYYETRTTVTCLGGEQIFYCDYTPGYLDVFLNGVKQSIGTEVTATLGTEFSFSTPLTVNDIVEYQFKKASAPYDYYIKSEIDAMMYDAGGATGGGIDRVFVLNDRTINSNYTIPPFRNAMTAGPITVADGISVTVGDNSAWVVV